MRAVLKQCSPGSKSVLFFNNPSETLPALFEFLFTLYAVDAHFTRELTGTVLVNLARCHHAGEGSVPAYSRTAALSALTAALPALFCKRALGMPLVRHTKEQLFRAVLAQFPSPHAVDFVVKFLFLARSHRASWQTFSRLAYAPAQALVQPLRHLRTPEDLWRLCSLWAVISPKGFALESWKKILNDSKDSARQCRQEGTPGEQQQQQSPLSPETELGRVLEVLGISWIPAFLAAARHALSVPTEAFTPPKDDARSEEEKAKEFEAMLCGVASAATVAVRNYAATRWCVRLPGVANAVALVVAATESLIRRMMSVVKSPAVRPETLAAALAAFESVLKVDDIVAVVKPFGSFVRLLSSLCTREDDGGTAALLFYHGVLARKFAGEEGERTSRNARESSLNIWLLGELAYFMKGAGRSFSVDETVLAKLFQNRTFIRVKLADLKCVFENEANTDMVLAAALRCITPSVTNRGARNFLAVMTQLPCTPKLTQVNSYIINFINMNSYYNIIIIII